MSQLVELGSAFRRPAPPSETAQSEARLLRAVGELREALASLPAPQVIVDRLTDKEVGKIVESVVALTARPNGPSVEELKEAFREVMDSRPASLVPEFPPIPESVDPTPALDRLADRFKALESILRGLAGQQAAYGASGPSNIADNANRQLGIVSVTGTVPTTHSSLTPKGYQQITSLAAAQSLTVPSGSTLAVMTPEGADLRWRDDGTNPTTSVGMPIAKAQSFTYDGNLSAFKVIEQTTGAKLNVAYYA